MGCVCVQNRVYVSMSLYGSGDREFKPPFKDAAVFHTRKHEVLFI